MQGWVKKITVFFCGLIFLCISQGSFALVVLQYHHISTTTPTATSIAPERFAAHLQWLKDQNFQVWSMPQFVDHWRKGKPLPDKTALITFDDGYTSIFTTAWPLLKQYGWPFTVFINSQHHDEKNIQYMTWEQLKTLTQAGVVIGNHSVSHPHMVRFNAGENVRLWRVRMEQEITLAQQRIDAELGRQPRVFAYPFGEYNRTLQDLLHKMDYLAFGQQSGPIALFDDPQALPRFPFGGIYGDAKDFALKAGSLPMPISAVEIRDAAGKRLRDPLLPQDLDPVYLQLSGESVFLRRVQCFFGGEATATQWQGNALKVHNLRPVPAGRSRFNCTAPERGRYYWLSVMVMKKNVDGSWYSE
jgi:biofilm PGA synthesis lipoprotein PgaB